MPRHVAAKTSKIGFAPHSCPLALNSNRPAGSQKFGSNRLPGSPLPSTTPLPLFPGTVWIIQVVVMIVFSEQNLYQSKSPSASAVNSCEVSLYERPHLSGKFG